MTTRRADTGRAITSFVNDYWSSVLIAVLLGLAFGFVFPTFLLLVSKGIEKLVALGATDLSKFVVWPRHAGETLIAILLVSVLFYGRRGLRYGLRLVRSLNAGLVSGVGTAWFLSSAAAFALYNFYGTYKSLSLLAIGFIASALAIYRDYLRPESVIECEAESDFPIKAEDKDILLRASIINQLVIAVADEGVPVVALVGGYGDGKSSVLNMVSCRLRKRGTIVVEFSTWLPNDRETLISTLFNSILKGLERSLVVPDVKRRLLGLTRIISTALPRSPVAIHRLLDEPSQSSQVQRLRDVLEDLPVRVAVILDDMDRVQRSELIAILKLIRGVTELPNLTYVCAFDAEALVQILHKRKHADALPETRRFLEKFMPEQVSLPKIPEDLLEREFERRFIVLCNRNNLLSDPDQRTNFLNEFRILWQQQLRKYFTNLRRIKLYMNFLRRTIPVIAQEVDLREFMLLECVRRIDPSVYEDIYRDAPFFMFASWSLRTWVQTLHPDESRGQAIFRSYFEINFKEYPKPPAGILLSLLSEIFPTVKSWLRGTDVPQGASMDSQAAGNRRSIIHPDFFPRYFIFSVPDELFGERQASDFISELNNQTDLAACISVFKLQFTSLEEQPMKRWKFLQKISESFEDLHPIAVRALPIAIAHASDVLSDAAQPSFDESVGRQIVFKSAILLQASEGVQTTIESVIAAATSDQFATDILNDCSNKKRREIQDWSAIDAKRLEECFRKRMESKFASGDYSFFPIRRPFDIRPMGRWARCGPEGKSDVLRYLLKEFATNHASIGQFLLVFFPTDKTSPLEDPRVGDPIGAIEQNYFPTNEIERLLEEFGNSAWSTAEEAAAVSEFREEYRKRKDVENGSSS